MVLPPTKYGKLRFCVEYGELSAMKVRDTYLLPRMDECILFLGNAKIFSVIDWNSGYWQNEILEVERDKTTFFGHRGFFRSIRKPF